MFWYNYQQTGKQINQADMQKLKKWHKLIDKQNMMFKLKLNFKL